MENYKVKFNIESIEAGKEGTISGTILGVGAYDAIERALQVFFRYDAQTLLKVGMKVATVTDETAPSFDISLREYIKDNF